jgi:outer membrane protein, heavy metal efflux system
MGTERLAIALLLGGCASSSIRSDVDRVRELTRAVELAAVADLDVDPATPDDVKRLLQEPLDADRALRIALLNNRELRAQLRSIGIARGELVQAGLIPNPVFEAEALPERDTRLELRLEYDLTSLLLAPIRAAAAESDLEAERYAAAGAVLDLSYQVRSSFYMFQSAEQRLAVAQRSLDGFAAARDAAEALLEAGNVPAIEALRPITAYERARVMVAKIELEVAGRRERLHRLLGLSGEETAWKTIGALVAVPEKLALVDRAETKAIEASLDLAAAKSRLEAIAHRTSVSRTEGWVPDVEVDVHSLYGDPEEDSSAPWRFGGGISLSLPVFDRNQGTTLRHESEFDAESERFQQVAIDLRSAVREARAKLESLHGRALHYQNKILPAQKRLVEQTLLHYNAMQIGVFDLLDAQRGALDLELEFLMVAGDFWSTQAALETLLAGKLIEMDGMNEMARPMMNASESPGGH